MFRHKKKYIYILFLFVITYTKPNICSGLQYMLYIIYLFICNADRFLKVTKISHVSLHYVESCAQH